MATDLILKAHFGDVLQAVSLPYSSPTAHIKAYRGPVGTGMEATHLQTTQLVMASGLPCKADSLHYKVLVDGVARLESALWSERVLGIGEGTGGGGRNEADAAILMVIIRPFDIELVALIIIAMQ